MGDKRAICCGVVTGVVFGVTQAIGKFVVERSLGNLLLLSGKIALEIVLFSFLYHLMLREDIFSSRGRYVKGKKWLLAWFLMFLCYLPCYIAFYPGIMSYDSKRITEQALGLRPFDNFQPFLHTVLWAACIRIEQRCGIAQSGIVIYSVSQMLILTGIFTYVLYFMVKNGGKILGTLSFLFYAFCPSIVLFSFITTKDILFGASVLLFVLLLIQLCEDTVAFMGSRRKVCLFTVTGIVCCLLRNNMIYVLILTSFAVPFMIRNERKKLMVSFMAVILGYYFIVGPVYGAIGVMPGYAREMLSVPMSQLANVYRNEGADLEPEDQEIMRAYIPDIEKYERHFADPIKYTFNEELYRENKGEFWGIWLKYLKQETFQYADAFLALNVPLWYMGMDTVDPYISLGLFSRHYTFEYKDVLPKVKEFYTKVAEYHKGEVGILQWPVVKQFFSVALPVWVLFIAVCALIAKKQRKWILPVLPLILLWMTYLLGPVSNFRYMFPIIISYPVIAMLVLQNRRLEDKQEDGTCQ